MTVTSVLRKMLRKMNNSTIINDLKIITNVFLIPWESHTFFLPDRMDNAKGQISMFILTCVCVCICPIIMYRALFGFFFPLTCDLWPSKKKTKSS